MAVQEYGMTASDGNKYPVGIVPACRKYWQARGSVQRTNQIRCLSIELDLQQEYIVHNYTDFQQGIRGWRMQITE